MAFEDVPLVTDTPFFARQTRVVLDNCGTIDPASLDAALAAGGFAAAARALTTMTPREVCDVVIESGLRGRGGAGFPTGQKWKIALEVPAAQKYLICNADEGDPGAFMDRAVLEGDPFRVIEGHADRGLRHRRLQRLRLLPGGVPVGHPAPAGRHRSVPQGRPAGHQHPRQPDRFRHHHQAGRRRFRMRRGDRDPGQHRRRARHAPAAAARIRRSPACTASRRCSTTWRPWPTSPASFATGRPGSATSA